MYVYDTHHAAPLVVCKNLHYAGLTDAAWSPDGRKLMVTSSDGYVTLLTFENGELGELTDAMVGEYSACAVRERFVQNDRLVARYTSQSIISRD